MVNKATIIGNLGRDPEVRFTPGGQAVCKFSVATTEKWTKDGEKKEETTWHNVVVWGKQAETCGQYLAKGRQVYVEGKIINRSYDDKDGNKKYITEIVARDVRFLGGKGGGDFVAPPGVDEDAVPAEPVKPWDGTVNHVTPGDTQDDIPF